MRTPHGHESRLEGRQERLKLDAYRGNGESLVEDAIVDQFPVDVAGCLGHALDVRNTALMSLSTHFMSLHFHPSHSLSISLSGLSPDETQTNTSPKETGLYVLWTEDEGWTPGSPCGRSMFPRLRPRAGSRTRPTGP